MRIKYILKNLERPVRDAIRDLERLDKDFDIGADLAELLLQIEVLNTKVNHQIRLAPSKVQKIASFIDYQVILEQEILKEARREAKAVPIGKPENTPLRELFEKKPKVPKEKPPKVPKPPKVVTPEYGTYGIWDYPNTQWERIPTEDDIPEIMNQKILRYPGNELWMSEQRMRQWFIDKGWS